VLICIFLLVGIVQDKALTALAIKDNKRQYVDVENYLEDVCSQLLLV